MSQGVPYNEIEICHGHPDLYMKKIEKISNSPDDMLLVISLKLI